MKHQAIMEFILVGFLVAKAVAPLSPRAFVLAAPGDAPHIGEGALPRFEKDLAWPQVPAKWKMGFGSAVAIDSDDNVWILSRPRTLAHPRSTAPDLTSTPAPPVMEFDQEGNFIRGWGGESGPGYQWPSNEHSITVDDKGFVWILGNADGKKDNPAGLPNDNQILKFTKDGKFVMAIGQSGQTGSNATQVLRGASGLRVYSKTNELFVSDGYGNSRVMVYDADTGKFKRMWGAYGNKPLDVDARPPRAAPIVNELCPSVCGIWEDLQQFVVPHDVNVSDDGLVYVSDRGNKRVQVFTTDGKFIAEQFVGLDSKNPLQARSTAFSPDQRFLYVAGSPVVYILNRKTLEVLVSFDVGSAQAHPPGHQLAADHNGNLYLVQTELTGADGKSGGTGAYRFVFKGYTPTVTCPPCQSTRVDVPNN
jgi:DNA-binding beta-propeller fold protein YncE